MPGTIQVSVVEFKSSSSPTSLKVSIGRRCYETWDNGEFSFPLTTLRDNLIVALQDADGNEIARTGVEIMLIVEKGSWDDYFPLEGGGEVHMKLHFVLSEEERDRVRMLRESALRKKQHKESTESVESSSIDFEQKITGMLNEIMAIVPFQNMETSVPPKIVSVEDEAAATSSLLGPESEYYSQFGTIKEEEKSSATPNMKEDSLTTEVEKESVETIQQLHANVGLGPGSVQEASPKLGLLGSELQLEKISISPKLNDDSIRKSEVQKPMKRTPTAVWKMISAFETNLSQDSRTPVKSPNMKSQSGQVGKRGDLKDTNSEDVTKPADPDSDILPKILLGMKDTSSFVNRATGNISSDTQAGEKLTAQNKEVTDSEREDVTKRVDSDSDILANSFLGMKDTSSFVNRTAGNISSDSQAREKLTVQNKEFADSERDHVRRISNEPHEEDDIDIKRVVEETSEASNSKELVKLPLDLIRNSERTFSGKEVMSSFEKHEPEDRRVLESENQEPEGKGEDLKSQGDHLKKDHRGLGEQRNSRPDGSPDANGGLVGQVIKIAIIVGFGVLVLLNRQRDPRKGKKQANDRFNEPSGFMDEGPFIVGPMD